MQTLHRMESVESAAPGADPGPWEPPRSETIDLACEISAYAPDDGEPLF